MVLIGQSHQKIATAPRRLVGNETLWLDQPDVFWRVESGAVGIFAVQWQGKGPVGKRRYLFTVAAGEVLLGARPRSLGLVAVALEPSVVVPGVWSELSASCEQSKLGVVTWIQHFAESSDSPTVSETGSRDRFLTLRKEAVYAPPALIWIQLQQGSVQWLGEADWLITPTTGVFPLSHGTWVKAVDETEIKLLSTEEIADVMMVSATVDQFHGLALQWLEKYEQVETLAEFQQFKARQQLNDQVTQQALQGLASLLKPEDDSYLSSDNALLVVAGAVGRALGVTIRPPAQSEEGQRIREPLESIARASQLRLRQVLLRGQWWTQDGGPIMAYTRDQHKPVALLPVGSHRYERFDPAAQPAPQRVPVDAEVANQIDPVAFVFYRPLPTGRLQAWDLLKFAFYGRQRDLWMILLTGLLTTLLGMVVPQATAVLVDEAIPYGSTGLLIQIGLALLAVAFGRASFQFAQAVAAMRVETGSDVTLQAAVWDRLLTLKTAFFRDYSTGDLQSRVSSITAIRRKLSGTALDAMLSGGFALINLGLLFYYSAKLAVLALLVALLVMVVTAGSGVLLLKKQRPLLELDGELYGLMVQLINGVSKLRIAGAEGRAFAQWGEKYRQQLRLGLSTQRLEDGVNVFNSVMPTITSIALFWVASTLVAPMAGLGLSTGTFLAFNAAFAIFISGATSLSLTMIEVLDVIPLWLRSQPILQAEPEVDIQKADPGRLSGHFCVDRVTFRYRDDGPLILDDVTVEAKPGEFIALVGPSGSGKSTVLRLLLGFEQPQAGTVYYDGQDLSGLDVAAVRRQLGVVLQNGRINAGSIFENISGGALISLDDAWKAAEMAGFAEDVRSFPMAMHTVISEGGGNLSGGQRQRLVIARALALNPKILLLDEATSALDNRTQAIVSESLDQLKVTRVVVAHRLSTIRQADRIYVIQSGRVVQQGSFEQLAAQAGLFAQLIQRQVA
jgi:NHLM bacteriocin system ABC transporter ATP-binding protein